MLVVALVAIEGETYPLHYTAFAVWFASSVLVLFMLHKATWGSFAPTGNLFRDLMMTTQPMLGTVIITVPVAVKALTGSAPSALLLYALAAFHVLVSALIRVKMKKIRSRDENTAARVDKDDSSLA